MEDLKTVTPLVFNHYFGQGSTHANRFNNWFSRIQNRLVRNVNDCMDLSGTELEVARKRRSRDDRTIFQTHELKGNSKQDFWAVMWGHASYIRETLLSNENCDDAKAMKLMRRIDRLRLIVDWQYCDKVDPDGANCYWVYKYNWDAPAKGISKGDDRPHPRQWDDFQEGGKYHQHFNWPY